MTRFQKYIDHKPQFACMAWVLVDEEDNIIESDYPQQRRTKTMAYDLSTKDQVKWYRDRGYVRCFYFPPAVKYELDHPDDLITIDGEIAFPPLEVLTHWHFSYYGVGSGNSEHGSAYLDSPFNYFPAFEAELVVKQNTGLEQVAILYVREVKREEHQHWLKMTTENEEPDTESIEPESGSITPG